MSTNTNILPFKLGDLECLVLRDTSGPIRLDILFPAVKPQDMEDYLVSYKVPRSDRMEVLCLLVRMPGHNILIDTGWGSGSQPNRGQVVSLLRSQGMEPEAIDSVVLSHGHPDHIGGNTDAGGKPLFPRAKYYMFRKEWDFWAALPDLKQIDKRIQQEMHSYVQKNMIPLRDRFVLVEDLQEFLPGIKYIPAPGHSEYHCLVNISSGLDELVYAGDLIHHPVQIPRPEISVFGDYDREQAYSSRKAFIPVAAESGTLVFACHFAFPGIGRIKKNADWFGWQPE